MFFFTDRGSGVSGHKTGHFFVDVITEWPLTYRKSIRLRDRLQISVFWWFQLEQELTNLVKFVLCEKQLWRRCLRSRAPFLIHSPFKNMLRLSDYWLRINHNLFNALTKRRWLILSILKYFREKILESPFELILKSPWKCFFAANSDPKWDAWPFLK